ncbi:MAG: hypothetical protein JKY93_00045 [Gammaproteobacteria bacterium]|nr:hypothetical protein [Gammaproteobacteria bacterium]
MLKITKPFLKTIIIIREKREERRDWREERREKRLERREKREERREKREERREKREARLDERRKATSRYKFVALHFANPLDVTVHSSFR